MSQNPDENPMDSKFEFWTQLPTEMRLECIKRMNFKARMQLRATSKQDKLLVESAPKYHFEKVIVELDVECMPNVICKKSNCSEVKFEQKRGKTTPEFVEKALQLAIQILKFAETENFELASKFTTDDAVSKFLADISNLAPFHFKSITLDCGKFAIIDFFFKNCSSLKSISFGECDNEIEETKMIEFINCSTVTDTKTGGFEEIRGPVSAYHQMVRKRGSGGGKNASNCSKTVETLRLRTKGPAGNHIFFRKIPNGSFFEQPTQVPCYSAIVIPSDKKDSEIENDDQFMKDICAKQWKRNCAPLDFTLPMEVRVELDPDLLAAALGHPEHYSDDEDFY